MKIFRKYKEGTFAFGDRPVEFSATRLSLCPKISVIKIDGKCFHCKKINATTLEIGKRAYWFSVKMFIFETFKRLIKGK